MKSSAISCGVSSASRGFDRLSIKGPSALQFVEARVEGNRVEVEVQTVEISLKCVLIGWLATVS